MARSTSPAAQLASCVFSGPFGQRSVVVSGDVTWRSSALRFEQLEDAHTAGRKNKAMHQVRQIVLTVMTDQDLTFLENLDGDVNLGLAALNGLVIKAQGVTNVSDEGLQQIVTTGVTNELTLNCDVIESNQATA